MATEEEDTQDRLDRLLVRVQSGMRLDEALTEEGCFKWFYSKLPHVAKLPIIRASREVQSQKRQEAQQLSGLTQSLSETERIIFELPRGQKADFKAACDQLGVTMNRRLCSLVSGDIARFKSGL